MLFTVLIAYTSTVPLDRIAIVHLSCALVLDPLNN